MPMPLLNPSLRPSRAVHVLPLALRQQVIREQAWGRPFFFSVLFPSPVSRESTRANRERPRGPLSFSFPLTQYQRGTCCLPRCFLFFAENHGGPSELQKPAMDQNKIQGCVKTSLLGFENNSQNVLLLTPKLHCGVIFQPTIPKTRQECSNTTLYIIGFR